jgi:paraquat-inducible protein A
LKFLIGHAMFLAAAKAEPVVTAGRLRECADCGLIQRVPPLPRGIVARCPRCAAVLRRRRVDPAGRALALALTGLLLFILALSEPFIDIRSHGLDRATTLLGGPIVLEEHGFWPLAAAVLVTTVGAPLARLLALAYVLTALQLRRPPRHLYVVFRWVEWLDTWAMAEVFLLGVFVAYTRLAAMAHVDVGAAVYALGGLTLATAAADSALDREAVWQGLERKGVTAGRDPGEASGTLFGCHSCGLVSRATIACPRCGATAHRRKPNSIRRTWALLIAAAILYLPANLLPVMTVVSLGHSETDTILAGVMALTAEGAWPLAALVFFASITVPLLKLFGLGWLLVSTQRHSTARLRERTLLYRIVDSVGRWSMIDVFMVSILTALVRMGLLASIEPGPGAISFAAVVILTILAAGTFEPRLMWDAAGRNAR